MRSSWFASVAAAPLIFASTIAAQAPGARIAYTVRLLERTAGDARLAAAGTIRGPQDTDLRLTLGSDTSEVDALLEVFPEPDTVNLTASFYTRRVAGRSRRGLPLWEVDSYHRETRAAWGATVRLYPYGPRHDALWLEISVRRDSVGGETRPDEAVDVRDSTIRLGLDAVMRPRRALVRLTLVRGDTVSAPQMLDLVPDAPGRRVTFVLGRHDSRAVDVSLARPDPPLTGRDSALAPDADVVCLRVIDAAQGPARVRCGRLNNVARRLPLAGGDTLLATFAWPAAR